MEKKVLAGFIIIVLGIMVISTYFFLDFFVGEEVEDSGGIVIDKGKVKEINIEQITSGASFVDALGQQYDDGEISTVFGYSGFYRGVYFDSEYVGDDGNVKMRITNKMNPSDGVIEGFAVAKIEDNKPIVQIFLDEDWKRLVGDTYIWSGVGYKKYQEFDFNEVSNGIYSDSIEDDPGRYLESYSIHLGGIIIGDVSKDKVEKRNEDITIIKFE